MKKILIVIVIVIFLVLSSLTVYYFMFYKNKETNTYFYKLEVSEEKKVVEYSDNFEETHPEYILDNNVKEIDFDLIEDGKGLTGKIYIDNQGYAYIYNKNTEEYKKISSVKFITMKSYDNLNKSLLVYIISESSELYMIKLDELDINKVTIKKMDTTVKVKKFTSLWIGNFEGSKEESSIVLSEDNKLYILPYMTMFSNKMIVLNNEYYIYDDDTITNIEGNLLKDKGGDDMKAKYYFYVVESDSKINNTNTIIITEDNKLIFIDNDNKYVDIYNKEVVSVEKSKDSTNYDAVNITINFKNGEGIKIKAIYFKGYYGL